MASVRHSTHDLVQLLVSTGRLPAGTVGTVVESDDARALVEFGDARGHAADFVTVPHEALRLAGAHEAESHAAS